MIKEKRDRILISESDIDSIKPLLPTDQAEHLKPGCVTWELPPLDEHDSPGRMTLWPEDGRAAVAFGAGQGASSWGDWNKERRQVLLDDKKTTIAEDGRITERPTIAVSLTEEQVKLLLSAEYPQDGQKQNTALNEIYAGKPIPIERESILLDRSIDSKEFFAKLEANEKPALDAKLTQLQIDKERSNQTTYKTNDRQYERQYSPSHSRGREISH